MEAFYRSMFHRTHQLAVISCWGSFIAPMFFVGIEILSGTELVSAETRAMLYCLIGWVYLLSTLGLVFSGLQVVKHMDKREFRKELARFGDVMTDEEYDRMRENLRDACSDEI